jgi:hypothetical protein
MIGVALAAYVFALSAIARRFGVDTRSEVFSVLAFASFLIVTIIFLVLGNYWAPEFMSGTQ